MRVGGAGADAAAVEVDDRGGRQRVQLGGDARHGRREDGGDQQADQADRQERGDERREDVVDVRVGGVAGHVAHQGPRLRPHLAYPPVALDERRCGRPRLFGVARLARRHHCRCVAPPVGVGAPELVVQRAVLAGPPARLDGRLMRLVEEHRRLGEEVEAEHQHAHHQDEHLQRDLGERAHQQRVPPGVDRLRRQIALHLALVAAEVAEHQEQPAQQAGPEGVRLVEVEREVDGLQPAGGAGDVQHRLQPHVVRQAEDQRGDRRGHPDHDDDHLLDVGPGDRLHAAEHRVNGRGNADRQDGKRQAPAEHDGEDDGRRGDDHARPEAARDQEQQAGQRPRAGVEAPLQVFVRREDACAVEERHQRQREDDHRQGQSEVELHEADAVVVALPRRPDQRDGAHLGGHHRQADGPPRERPRRQEIAFDGARPPGPLHAVVQHPGEVGGDDGPVDQVHRAL